MPSSATQGTSFCCAIHRESPYTTAGTNGCPTGSGIGEHGLGAYGQRKLRALMELAHASLNNALSAFIWISIFVPAMWGSVAQERQFSTSMEHWRRYWILHR